MTIAVVVSVSVEEVEVVVWDRVPPPAPPPVSPPGPQAVTREVKVRQSFFMVRFRGKGLCPSNMPHHTTNTGKDQATTSGTGSLKTWLQIPVSHYKRGNFTASLQPVLKTVWSLRILEKGVKKGGQEGRTGDIIKRQGLFNE